MSFWIGTEVLDVRGRGVRIFCLLGGGVGWGVGSTVGTTLGCGAGLVRGEGIGTTLGGGTGCGACVGAGVGSLVGITLGGGAWCGIDGVCSVKAGGGGMGGGAVARCRICAMCIYALLIGVPYSSVGTSGVVERFVLRMVTRSVAA